MRKNSIATAAQEVMPSPPPMTARLHGLDHLRAAAMFLGITIHAVIPYITEPAADVWPARNDVTGHGFDLIAGIIHGFRMQLFFLLSGFFARLVFQRVGPRGFAKHRLLRIGLPFAVGMLTLVPLVHWQWNFQLEPLATTHLWFLEYLLVYSFVALPIALWEPKPAIDRILRGLLATRWKGFLLAVPTAVLMLWSPIWDEAANARGTTLLPNFLALVYYALFFLFGWAMHKHSDLLGHFQRGAVWQFFAGLACLIIWGAVQLRKVPIEPNFFSYLAGSSVAWLFSFSFIAVFLRHLDFPSAVGRYLADSAYWVYLAHLPLLIALQKWIVPLSLNPWLELLLLHLVAIPLLLFSYEYLVRYTFIGAVLNGPRTRAEQRSSSSPR
jgi:glucans biosynthesis protein C